MSSHRLVALLALTMAAGVAAASPRLALLGDGAGALPLRSLYEQAGYAVETVAAAGLEGLDAGAVPVLVLPPRTVFPPSARQALSRYLVSGGCLVDLSPDGLAYDREPLEPVPVPGLDRPDSVERVLPAGVTASPVVLADGLTTGLAVEAPFVGMEEIALRLPLASSRHPERTMVCFEARGAVEVDALRVALRDDRGARFIAFVELTPSWQEYALPMADFIRVGAPAEAAPVDPGAVQTLAFELSYKVVWKEARGGFAVGRVALARASRFDGVPSAAVARWRNRYERSGAAFPAWILDPFLGTRPLAGPLEVAVDGAGSGGFGPSAAVVPSAWAVPPPVPFRGTEDLELRDALALSARLRQPWCRAVAAPVGAAAVVGEVRTLLGGPQAPGTLILGGLPEADLGPGSTLGQALVAATDRVVRAPRLVAVQPITTPDGQPTVRLGCRVSLRNPLDAAVPATLTVSLADGLLQATGAVDLAPRGQTETVLWIGEVPAAFPLTRFGWRVCLEASGRADCLEGTADVEGALVDAARYLLRLQETHPDGRYSLYFFTDAYAARFLHALAGHLEAPGVRERLERRLGEVTPEALRASAYRFCDLVIDRQDASGGLPIGYADRDDLRYTADGGSIALGFLQIAGHCADPLRRARYLEAGRRYAAFREALFITPETSARLQAQFGPGSPGTQAGFYGLGTINADLVTKTGRWPEPRLEERGLYWVMPISVGAICALHRLDPAQETCAEVIRRDAAEYLGKDCYPLSRASYFHVEGLLWLLEAVADEPTRAALRERIHSADRYARGEPAGLTYLQGRGALHWLNLATARALIGDSPAARAGLAQIAWTMAAASTALSLDGLAERFPTSVYGPSAGGYRCLTHSAIALMELLQPGSTLLPRQP